ncbi:MAG: Large-conductance mechanosensitive channel [Candidatus Parcubacteria bacterium]
MSGFIDFIRKQGVVGLAVGFILGGAVSKLVTSLIENIINPILGVILGAASGLTTATFAIGPIVFKYGAFLSTLIDFIVIAMVVYYGVHALKLDRLDKPKA